MANKKDEHEQHKIYLELKKNIEKYKNDETLRIRFKHLKKRKQELEKAVDSMSCFKNNSNIEFENELNPLMTKYKLYISRSKKQKNVTSELRKYSVKSRHSSRKSSKHSVRRGSKHSTRRGSKHSIDNSSRHGSRRGSKHSIDNSSRRGSTHGSRRGSVKESDKVQIAKLSKLMNFLKE
jgi:hypothetical protein